MGDQEGLGGKIADDDKETILAALKESTEWIKQDDETATADNLEEELASVLPCITIL